MTNWLSGVIGQGIASSIGATGHMAQQNAAQATQYGLAQNSAQAQAMAAQQAYGANMAAGHSQQWRPPPKWMFDGKFMEFDEFVEKMFPEDTPAKTMFVLQYTKEDK